MKADMFKVYKPLTTAESCKVVKQWRKANGTIVKIWQTGKAT